MRTRRAGAEGAGDSKLAGGGGGGPGPTSPGDSFVLRQSLPSLEGFGA